MPSQRRQLHCSHAGWSLIVTYMVFVAVSQAATVTAPPANNIASGHQCAGVGRARGYLNGFIGAFDDRQSYRTNGCLVVADTVSVTIA